MAHRATISLITVLLLTLVLSAAPRKEYFTEDELDLVRDAQELNVRVPVYLKLAERRLIILGVAEKSDKQKEKERKDQEQYEKDKKKAGNKASTVKPPVDELAYLHDFTRSELLRGYIEAIEEVMSNIDDSYELSSIPAARSKISKNSPGKLNLCWKNLSRRRTRKSSRSRMLSIKQRKPTPARRTH